MNNTYEMTDREYRSYKRQQRLRRRRINRALTFFSACFITVLFIVIGALSYDSIQSKANSGYKFYTSITVEAGDTLWSIAEKYIDYDHYKSINKYIDEVNHINHFDENEILVVGQKFVVPYYSLELVY